MYECVCVCVTASLSAQPGQSRNQKDNIFSSLIKQEMMWCQ